jgi:hypothetical protein
MTVPACPESRYRALHATGPDAVTFLQGQLTQDVATAPAEPLSVGALLTPQGRVLTTTYIVHTDGGRTLLVPDALADDLLSHLKRFVLRAKLSLALAAPDPALREVLRSWLGGRLAGTPADDWTLALVGAGIPEIEPATRGEWVPQMLNLDLLGGISFRKGCYTGQEIVARTQHLGRIKRRMFRLATEGAPPPAGSAVHHGETKVGEVVIAAAKGSSCELLAVLGLEAPVTGLTLADGRSLERLALPYALS